MALVAFALSACDPDTEAVPADGPPTAEADSGPGGAMSFATLHDPSPEVHLEACAQLFGTPEKLSEFFGRTLTPASERFRDECGYTEDGETAPFQLSIWPVGDQVNGDQQIVVDGETFSVVLSAGTIPEGFEDWLLRRANAITD